MDRFAVFVDAGYLYAASGELCCGSKTRSAFQLDPVMASAEIALRARTSCSLPLLRIYWYDAAWDGIPTREQRQVAALPNVKLRLGRVDSRGRQRGVDALIYRDLMTLARERAICDAFLLAGDEDLREGVKVAQDLGVRVTLIGVSTAGEGWNQSRDLVNEADDLIMLDKEDLLGFIECLPESSPDPEDGNDLATQGRLADHGDQSQGEASVDSKPPMPVVQSAASKFAAQWLEGASIEEVESVLAGKPGLPSGLDSELMSAVAKEAGRSLWDQESLRKAARGAFRLKVQQWASSRSDAEN